MASNYQKLTEDEKQLYKYWTWTNFERYCRTLYRHSLTTKELDRMLAIQEYIKEKEHHKSTMNY